MTKIFPITHVNIHLPSEPATSGEARTATCNRSYCLRQPSETQWQTAYYNEDKDCFYYECVYTTYVDASEAFRTELNRQMDRYDYFVRMFFKYRSYIVSQEAQWENEIK